MMALEESVATTKRCRGACKQDLPLDAFSPNQRSPDGRHAWCRACRCGRARTKTHKGRARSLSKTATTLANAGDIALVAAVLRGCLVRFGGLDRFLAEFVHQIQLASGRRHGNTFALKAFRGIFNLLCLNAQAEEMNAPDYSNMSEQELDEYMIRAVVELLAAGKLDEAVLDRARELGWGPQSGAP